MFLTAATDPLGAVLSALSSVVLTLLILSLGVDLIRLGVTFHEPDRPASNALVRRAALLMQRSPTVGRRLVVGLGIAAVAFVVIVIVAAALVVF